MNRASFDELLRVPGIGTESAYRIMRARKLCLLTWDGLKQIGVVLKRARYFLLCKGRTFPLLSHDRNAFLLDLMSPRERDLFRHQERHWFQPSLFDDSDGNAGQRDGISFVPALDDRQKEALECVAIPVFC